MKKLIKRMVKVVLFLPVTMLSFIQIIINLFIWFFTGRDFLDKKILLEKLFNY